MLYSILKFPAQLALRIFCKRIVVNDKTNFAHTGPLLIAANHPNSFLDAIILATLFKKPIYSLARGDAFINPFIKKILNALHILPVYRITEGAENLNTNYDTFERCREIFKQDGIVLIFSEGLCVNEWKLRALKKGTARLAFSCWQAGIPLTVLPTGINYHSFDALGKVVELHFGEPIHAHEFDLSASDGVAIKSFNAQLKNALQPLVIEKEKTDRAGIVSRFDKPIHPIKKRLLFLPAMFGKWLHAPIYKPLQQFSAKRYQRLDHYDSVLLGLLFLLYPIFVLALAVTVSLLLGLWMGVLVFVLLPLLAWSYVQWKTLR